MTFPTSPSDGDRHVEDGVTYFYKTHSDSNKNEWIRKPRDTERALSQALLDIADLKARVTTLES